MDARAVSVHVVAHTRWDRESYLTREQLRLRLVSLLDAVLDRMDAGAGFRHFHLDGQTILLEDYLEQRPAWERRLAQRIAEGRLLVGPWYVMPELFLVSGEAVLRNLALGCRTAERFGGVMSVGYMPDAPGQPAQMPQLLAGFGLDAAIVWRGFGGGRAEYLWEGPDGSRVLLLHLPPEGSGNANGLPLLTADAIAEGARAAVAREARRSAFGTVLLMAGADYAQPHPRLVEVVECLARTPGTSASFSTLPAYASEVRERWNGAGESGPTLLGVRGELRGGEDYAKLLPGILSTRAYLKQQNAAVQNALERWAEPVSVFAWMCGQPYPRESLGYAWRTLLQNHARHSIGGSAADAVHAENETRFARALDVAASETERGMGALARRVAPPPEGAIRLLLVNTQPYEHAGVATGLVEIPLAGLDADRAIDASAFALPLRFFSETAVIARITDDRGRVVPFQVLGGEPAVAHWQSAYDKPLPVRVRRLHVALWVEALPACGYAAFDVHLAESTAIPVAPPRRVAVGDGFIENDHLRVEVGEHGTLDVRDKRSGLVYRRCAELLDSGDVGDAFSYSPPLTDRAVTSAEARGVTVRVLEAGPLRASLRVELLLPLPAEAAEDRSARSGVVVLVPVTLDVRLDAGSGELDLLLTVENLVRDHRLRVLFPTGAPRVANVRADTAFAAVERPARRDSGAGVVQEAPVSSAPLQSFVDAGDERAGITLLSGGLCEYEVQQGTRDSRLALTLLRCVGSLSRDDLRTRRGHAGAALLVPGAQCPGRREFRFAIAPRAAPPSAHALFAKARAWLAPPGFSAHAGRSRELPLRQAFLGVECEPAGAAVLSACKLAEDRDSLIVRFFNPDREPARVFLRTPRTIREAYETDLRERRGRTLPLDAGGVLLELGPQRIQTLELVLGDDAGL